MDERICERCGAVLSGDASFCVQCGYRVYTDGNYEQDGSYESPRFESPESYTAEPKAKNKMYGAPLDSRPAGKKKPGADEPVSTWEFIGIHLLLFIPVVNIILLIVWACGGCRKTNLRNFARAKLVIFAIILVLFVILSMRFASWFMTIGFDQMNEWGNMIEYYTA